MQLRWIGKLKICMLLEWLSFNFAYEHIISTEPSTILRSLRMYIYMYIDRMLHAIQYMFSTVHVQGKFSYMYRNAEVCAAANQVQLHPLPCMRTIPSLLLPSKLLKSASFLTALIGSLHCEHHRWEKLSSLPQSSTGRSQYASLNKIRHSLHGSALQSTA